MSRTGRSRSAIAPGAALAALAAVLPAGASDPVKLSFVESFEIHDKSQGFTEPSGLALSADGSHLWSVSDDSATVVRLGFDGRATAARNLRAPSAGMEGIAATPDGASLLMVQEDDDRIYMIDLATGEVVADRALADIDGFEAIAGSFDDTPSNKGLEGIATHPETGGIFVLKEAEPRMLIELSPGLDRIVGSRILGESEGFASHLGGKKGLDVSGIAFDPARKRFWIASDRGRRLFLYDHASGKATSAALLATVGGKVREVKQAEGVAIDTRRGRLYVVTDDGRKSRLHVYSVD